MWLTCQLFDWELVTGTWLNLSLSIKLLIGSCCSFSKSVNHISDHGFLTLNFFRDLWSSLKSQNKLRSVQTFVSRRLTVGFWRSITYLTCLLINWLAFEQFYFPFCVQWRLFCKVCCIEVLRSVNWAVLIWPSSTSSHVYAKHSLASVLTIVCRGIKMWDR